MSWVAMAMSAEYVLDMRIIFDGEYVRLLYKPEKTGGLFVTFQRDNRRGWVESGRRLLPYLSR